MLFASLDSKAVFGPCKPHLNLGSLLFGVSSKFIESARAWQGIYSYYITSSVQMQVAFLLSDLQLQLFA